MNLLHLIRPILSNFFSLKNLAVYFHDWSVLICEKKKIEGRHWTEKEVTFKMFPTGILSVSKKLFSRNLRENYIYSCCCCFPIPISSALMLVESIWWIIDCKFLKQKIENNSLWVNFTHFREKTQVLAHELIFISSKWRVYT